MDEIRWLCGLSVGVDRLDNEHKSLFTFYNTLALKLSESQVLETHCIPSAIFSDIFDYINNHFEHEEDYMRDINYPYIDQHIQQHEEIVKYIVEFHRGVSDELNLGEAQRLAEFIGKWLVHHIMHTDSKYAEYAKTII